MHAHSLRRLAEVGLALALALGGAACAGLPPFTADLHRRQVGERIVRAPYATVVAYFGYVAPGAPLEEVDGHDKGLLLYAWLPETVEEVGVRVVSPVAKRLSPRPEVDVVDPAFPARSDSQVSFDPAVRLERCLSAINPEDILKPCPQWVALGENDDSEELPADRAGHRRNALLRVPASRVDPLRALVRGLYRVVVQQTKVGEVQGTFVVQVGVPGMIDGLEVARDVGALAQRVRPAGERGGPGGRPAAALPPLCGQKIACAGADGRLPSAQRPPEPVVEGASHHLWTPLNLHNPTCSP